MKQWNQPTKTINKNSIEAFHSPGHAQFILVVLFYIMNSCCYQEFRIQRRAATLGTVSDQLWEYCLFQVSRNYLMNLQEVQRNEREH